MYKKSKTVIYGLFTAQLKTKQQNQQITTRTIILIIKTKVTKIKVKMYKLKNQMMIMTIIIMMIIIMTL